MTATDYKRSSEYKNSVEADKSSGQFGWNFEKFKEKHEKIRKHMEKLAKKYHIENFSSKLKEQYDKLRSNARFSKMSEYLNLIDAWVETFKHSSFSLDKLDKFQTDISLLVLALKENLEDTNEKVENWLEVMANKDSIAETADRADEAVLARSKYEQQMLFEEMRQNRNTGTAMA